MYLPTLHLGWLVVRDCVTNTFADNPHEEKELAAWGEYLASPPLQHNKWFLEKGLEKGIGCKKIKREWNQAYRKVTRTVFQQGPFTVKADSGGNLFCPQKSGACQIHSTCSFYLRVRQAFVFRHKWNFDGTFSPVLLGVSRIVLDGNSAAACCCAAPHRGGSTRTHARTHHTWKKVEAEED